METASPAGAVGGRLLNQLRDRATVLDTLPEIAVSPDPLDNYLLAIAQAGRRIC